MRELVRDRIPEIMRADGREPRVKKISGPELTAALYEKLIEEHSEFIAETVPDKKLGELADMVEVILTIAQHHGMTQTQLMDSVAQKREAKSGFSEGLFYLGEV
jgi:predicted house-cleaning noncanonical NTP pyrophosphatase (MazG superfamily)